MVIALKTMRDQSTGLARRDAEQRDPPAHDEVFDHLVERGLVAGHLQADVEALLHAEFGHNALEVFAGDIHRGDVGDLTGSASRSWFTSVMTTCARRRGGQRRRP
jgi:hypothetical protein